MALWEVTNVRYGGNVVKRIGSLRGFGRREPPLEYHLLTPASVRVLLDLVRGHGSELIW